MVVSVCVMGLVSIRTVISRTDHSHLFICSGLCLCVCVQLCLNENVNGCETITDG